MDMVKRLKWNTYLYLFFALILLMVSWEHNKTMAAVVEGDIPEDSIRLRILANSDSIEDQALKRRVRDAVVEQMNTWVSGPTTLEEARVIVTERIPVLESVVEQQIRKYGYDYTYKVELGIVPFPAKMYGDKVYPAGDYEALRITIGAGAGQNWWCVLFPPLCFVDAAKGEAVTKDDKTAEGASAAKDAKDAKDGKNSHQTAKDSGSQKDTSKDKDKTQVKAASNGKKEAAAADVRVSDSSQQQDGKKETKKVRFFFWEKVKSWFA
jgi:stage II sporulation protein R